jgi:predicted ATPase/DNA-binding SARP family transcriptional activator
MSRLFLFGAPHIEQNGQAVPLRRSKALALLAYLAVTRRPQDRDTLLALLWPEFDAASARNNLRRELSLLKATLGQDLLVVDRQQVAWNTQLESWLDVAAFQEQIAIRTQHGHASGALCAACAATLTNAAQLATDEFMAGFSLPESPAFDEWQFFQRETLRQQLAEVLQVLISWHSGRGEYGAAIEHARRWLALDSLHEPAQRELMRIYALAGQPAAALRQYEESVRLLDKELGVGPEAATTALHEDIKARRLTLPAGTSSELRAQSSELPEPELKTQSSELKTQNANLPHEGPTQNSKLKTMPLSAAKGQNSSLPSTSGFVGRQVELADVIRRLTDPDCRLLTLAGPGGCGKTRLALRVAQTLAETWTGDDEIADGVLFVPLAAVSTSGGLISALAAAAHFDFYSNVAPQPQVLNYFRTKRMLIVLDNFEQLLGAAGFIGELLAAAPRLRLLVTSRVALNLHEEWFHPIGGLVFPTADDDVTNVAQLARFDAVRLFEQHARRARSTFSLSRERTHVVRLCQLVAGMPLAIELAAAWLKVLPIERIVAALERDLGILTARDRDMPERHRSMRTVLEESWNLLSAEEQRILARLAVFAGGFSVAAAQSVAEASFDQLAAFVEQSLVRSVASGRFQMHELLCQFAHEKLVAGDEEVAVRQQHSGYYLTLLSAWDGAVASDNQSAGRASIDEDIENIQAAWSWAVAQSDIAAIDQALDPLFFLYQSRSRYQEGLANFAAAAGVATSDTLAEHPRLQTVRARLLARLGGFCYLLGDYSTALVHLETSLDIARALSLRHVEAMVLAFLGWISAWRCDYSTAQQQLRRSLEINRAIGDTSSVATVLENLAEILFDLGDAQEAKQLALESLALSRELRRPDLIAYAFDRLGYMAFCLGEYDEAASHYQASLAGFESLDHELGRALALGGMGLIAWARGETQAWVYYEQSLAISRKIGHQQRILERLLDLSQASCDSGEYVQAQRYAQEALTIARRLGSLIYVANSLSYLGRAAGGLGDYQSGRAYLVEALGMASTGKSVLAGTTALLYTAVLIMQESQHADIHTPSVLQRSLLALVALEIVVCHPASWHVYRVQARRLSDQLQRTLPPDLAGAAIARGQNLDWQAGVAAMLGELDTPG